MLVVIILYLKAVEIGYYAQDLIKYSVTLVLQYSVNKDGLICSQGGGDEQLEIHVLTRPKMREYQVAFEICRLLHLIGRGNLHNLKRQVSIRSLHDLLS